jgi:hypothetical protein
MNRTTLLIWTSIVDSFGLLRANIYGDNTMTIAICMVASKNATAEVSKSERNTPLQPCQIIALTPRSDASPLDSAAIGLLSSGGALRTLR